MKGLNIEVNPKCTIINICGLKYTFKSVLNKYTELVEVLNWVMLSFPETKQLLEEIKEHYNNKCLLFSYKSDLKKVKAYLKILDATKLKKAEGKLREYQLRILSILQEIIPILHKNNFHPMLIGGTLLGAIRHGGFIPWDDDFDFEIMRDEYIKFKEFIASNYIVLNTRSCKSSDDFFELLDNELQQHNNSIIFAEKPTCLSLHYGTSLEDCITIDFFPRDYLNPNLTKEDYKKYLDKYKKIMRKPKSWKEFFEIYEQEMNNKNIYRQESALTATGWGNVGCFSPKTYSFVPKEVILPYSKIKFEDMEFYTVNSPQTWLEDFFGDYMRLPASIKSAYIETYDKWLKKHGRKYYIEQL